MKTLIQENHFLKRMWEEACFQRDLQNGKLDDLLGDESGFEKRKTASFTELKRKFEEREASMRTIPSPIGRMKFKLASRYAVALARHYEMNVHIKASDSLGIIELGNDEIMFDTLWNDGKLKRRFLLLILLASSSCMQSKTESGNTFLFIWMSYDLERRIRWS